MNYHGEDPLAIIVLIPMGVMFARQLQFGFLCGNCGMLYSGEGSSMLCSIQLAIRQEIHLVTVIESPSS